MWSCDMSRPPEGKAPKTRGSRPTVVWPLLPPLKRRKSVRYCTVAITQNTTRQTNGWLKKKPTVSVWVKKDKKIRKDLEQCVKFCHKNCLPYQTQSPYLTSNEKKKEEKKKRRSSEYFIERYSQLNCPSYKAPEPCQLSPTPPSLSSGFFSAKGRRVR